MPFIPKGKTAQTWLCSFTTGASDAAGTAESVSIQQINGQPVVPVVYAFQKLVIKRIYTSAVQGTDFLIQPIVNNNPQGNSPTANSVVVTNQSMPPFSELKLKAGSNISFVAYLLAAVTAVTTEKFYVQVEYQE
ncbi:MAG: hypothetical protein QXL94_04460 [Candidatus Parvarchaeum sp.]